MTTPTTTKITYRKTNAGEWVAFGPAAALHTGSVTVSKKDGATKTETVTRLGKPFTAAGVQMVYGYLAPRATSSSGRKPSGRSCDECGQRAGHIECDDSSGLWGLCCSRCASMSPYERSFA